KRRYNGEGDVKGLLKIKGQPPEPAQKDLLEAQLKATASLVLFPGNAMFPAAPAEVKVEGGVVRLIHSIDARLPAIGEVTQATLTVAVGNAQVNTELIGLQGPDWDKQPVYETPPGRGQLARVPLDFKVVEIDLQPGPPRPGPGPGPSVWLARPPAAKAGRRRGRASHRDGRVFLSSPVGSARCRAPAESG